MALGGDSELALSPGTSSLPTKKHNLLRINWIGQRLTWQVAPWTRRELAPHLRAGWFVERFLESFAGVQPLFRDERKGRYQINRQCLCNTCNMKKQWCRIEIRNHGDVRDGWGSDAGTLLDLYLCRMTHLWGTGWKAMQTLLSVS